MSETVHATCVAIGGRGVLIRGRSGSGKSDLALRLIDRGARLVGDDYVTLAQEGGRILACAPETIAGKLEVRGIGIVEIEPVADVPICLVIDLDRSPERLPDRMDEAVLPGAAIPILGLAALEASAPLKLEQALLRFGLPLP
ncbi:MAG TPA: HPr kinase/phosphatase C-terminal domain-containing protein [Allosphingosinicella sp.]|nr:HPr kinase/phosphatase C-terminal domain-containing protein [Allosphingosinicella sp.]